MATPASAPIGHFHLCPLRGRRATLQEVERFGLTDTMMINGKLFVPAPLLGPHCSPSFVVSHFSTRHCQYCSR